MSTPKSLSLPVLGQLLSPDALHFLAYSWVFGQTIWVSFIGGVIAHKTLPRPQFISLQAKSFPAHFGSSLLISSALLARWIYSHPRVLEQLSSPLQSDVAQAYALASVVLLQGTNYFHIGPTTNTVIHARVRQEKVEGKKYTDKNISPELTKLNRQFGMWHGISSLANLFTLFALLFHGLWLGAFGTGAY
jgi:hypothetical protein